MNAKILFLTIVLISSTVLCTGFIKNKKQSAYFNPTGTYYLVSNAIKRQGDIIGITGSIQVKAIAKNKVVIVLGVDNGAPGYHSGLLLDTMIYKDNRCFHNGDHFDPSCKIVFIFTQSGVKVNQREADPNNACGFGQGVFVDGFYKKKSSKIPVLRDPQTDQLIK